MSPTVVEAGRRNPREVHVFLGSLNASDSSSILGSMPKVVKSLQREWPVKDYYVRRRNPYKPDGTETTIVLVVLKPLLKALGEKLRDVVLRKVKLLSRTRPTVIKTGRKSKLIPREGTMTKRSLRKGSSSVHLEYQTSGDTIGAGDFKVEIMDGTLVLSFTLRPVDDDQRDDEKNLQKAKLQWVQIPDDYVIKKLERYRAVHPTPGGMVIEISSSKRVFRFAVKQLANEDRFSVVS